MKKSVSRGRNEMLFTLLWGLLSGAAVIAVGIFACAFVLTKQDLPESAAVSMGTACIAIGAAIAGFVAARIRGSQGMVVGAMTGGAMFLIMVVVSVLVSGTQFTVVTFVRLMLCISLSALGGIVGVNLAAKRKMIK